MQTVKIQQGVQIMQFFPHTVSEKSNLMCEDLLMKQLDFLSSHGMGLHFY